MVTWLEDLLTFVLHANGVEHSPQRRSLNFIGAQLTDDSTNGWTTVYIGNTNDWKGSVRVATTEDLSAIRTDNTLTASANGNINTLGGIDGITNLATGDLFLAKDEAAGADNGIWRLTFPGTIISKWTAVRATLADESVEVTPGLTTYVEEGAVNARSTYRLKSTNVTINVTNLEFESMRVDASVLIDNTDSPYDVLLGQRVVLVKTSLGAVTVNLPPAADWKYSKVWVKDESSQAAVNNITIAPDGAELIDDASPLVITTARQGIELYSDGSAIHWLNRGS